MPEWLLALAAMGAFAGAAQAQSSVSVYGLYDGGLNTKRSEMNVNGTKTMTSSSDMTGNQQTSSRLGFRGVEDLGGGLTAMFNYELGFNPGTGSLDTVQGLTAAGQSASDPIRTSIVGLSSKQFGSVEIGRQLTGVFGTAAGDIFGGSNMDGDVVNANFGGATGNTTAQRLHQGATRINGLTYRAPNIAGLLVRLDYSNNLATTAAGASTSGLASTNTTAEQTNNQGITGTYVNGPFKVAFSNHRVASNSNITSSNGQVSKRNINIGSVAYIDKGLTVQVTTGNNKVDTNNLQATKGSATRYAVSYAVTPAITPFAMYGNGKSEMTVAAPVTSDNTGYLFGTNYTLSKRTRLYGVYGYQKSDIKSTTTSKTNNEIGLGVVHTF